jgi:Domain of unknown function (DUF4333)
MPMCSRQVRFVALATLALTTAACTTTLDTDGLEGMLQADIERTTGREIVSVECPADIEVEVGRTFNCTAEEASGVRLTLEVTQTSDRGDVRYEFVGAAA